jgi:hypothetical protein
MTPLDVYASHPDIEQYQKLLKSDFSRDTMKSVLSLLWKLIAESLKPTTFTWQKVLEYPARPARTKLNVEVIDTIRQAASLLRDPHLPPVKRAPTKVRLDHSMTEAQQVWTYLCLQTLADLRTPKHREAAIDLFHDLQSLLFLCSIEEVLPGLKKQGLAAEHDLLVNAHFIHTIIVWKDNPSHQFYLQSVLMDYLGEYDLAIDLRALSLRLTDVDDHSYLTKAQALWSDLMDLGRAREAYSFIFNLARFTPREYLPELEDMAALTSKVLNGSTRKH